MKPSPLTLASLLCAALCLTPAGPARARDLSLMGGISDSPQTSGHTYSWQIDYRHQLLKNLSLGFTYLNEGHLTDHHRDGYAPQAWAHLPLLEDRLVLSAGVGPYVYFDTVPSDSSPSGYRNEHGVKILSSLSAAWYTERNWFVQLQGNYLSVGSSVDTVTALAGVGYHFADPSAPAAQTTEPRELHSSEITVMLGQTIANSLGSQYSVAAEVEYRHRFIPHLEGSVAFLFEGDSRLIRRDGLITELWVTEDLLRNRLGVGIGAGAYFDIETYKTLKSERVSGIVTLTTTYRLSPRIDARLSWNRIVTNYDRDSDVIVAGAGYLF